MKTFTRQIYINTTLEELFDFHMDTNNLLKITPPDIKATLVTKNIQQKEGEVISLITTKNFLSFLWIVRIKKINFPTLFVDEALKSPFKYWEHQHIFEKRGNKVLLKDVVKYELPFGFIGKIFNSFIESDLQKMFEFRHKVTKNILEGKI